MKRIIPTLVLILTLLPVMVFGQPDGPNSPSTSSSSGGGTVWADIGDIYADDTDRARSYNITKNGSSQTLIGAGYGFAIPVGATIDGIEVTIIRRRGGGGAGTIRDKVVSLTKDGSTLIGDNKMVGTAWGTDMIGFSYGGAADLWGLTWTVAEINSGGFGIGLQVDKK